MNAIHSLRSVRITACYGSGPLNLSLFFIFSFPSPAVRSRICTSATMLVPRPAKRLRLEEAGAIHGHSKQALLLDPLPHARSDCAEHAFLPAINNASYRINKNACAYCYCLVCDIRVSECTLWPLHCMAYFQAPEWQELREKTRETKKTYKVPVELVPPCVTGNPRVSRFIASNSPPVANHPGVPEGAPQIASRSGIAVYDLTQDLAGGGDLTQGPGPHSPASKSSVPDIHATTATPPKSSQQPGLKPDSSAGIRVRGPPAPEPKALQKPGSKPASFPSTPGLPSASQPVLSAAVAISSVTIAEKPSPELSPPIIAHHSDGNEKTRSQEDGVGCKRDTEMKDAPKGKGPGISDPSLVSSPITPMLQGSGEQNDTADASVSRSPGSRTAKRLFQDVVCDDGISSRDRSDIVFSKGIHSSSDKQLGAKYTIASPVTPHEPTVKAPHNQDAGRNSTNSLIDKTTCIQHQKSADPKSVPPGCLSIQPEIISRLARTQGLPATSVSPRANSAIHPHGVNRKVPAPHPSITSSAVRSAKCRAAKKNEDRLIFLKRENTLVEPNSQLYGKSYHSPVHNNQMGMATSSALSPMPQSTPPTTKSIMIAKVARAKGPARQKFVQTEFGKGGTSVSSPEIRARKELAELRSLWNPDKVFPSDRILRKSANPSTWKSPSSLPKRVLIGSLDLWLPHCSHMSASTFCHSLGTGDRDITSMLNPGDFKIPDVKAEHVKILAKEMGFSLDDPTLSSVYDQMSDGYCSDESEGGQCSKPRYYDESKTAVHHAVLESLRSSIQNDHLEVRWELLHYKDATNAKKVFAVHHRLFETWDTRIRLKLEEERINWLQQCDRRIQNVEKLDLNNSCVLKGWLFATPKAFTSNMVVAFKTMSLNSPFAHMYPVDGGSTHVDRLNFAGNSLQASRYRKPYDDLEVSTQGSCTAHLKSLMAHMRPLTQASGRDNGNSCSVLDSALTIPVSDECTTFSSICQTFTLEKDSKSLRKIQVMMKDLCEVTKSHDGDAVGDISIRGLLSSTCFAVSSGYNKAAQQPSRIRLSLRLYQRESLAWMLDQENKRSISDPFWVKLRGNVPSLGSTELFYCPFNGALSRFPPPPVVGGVLAEEMGLGKTIIATALIVETLQQALSFSKEPGDRPDLVRSRATLIICPVSLLKQWEKELSCAVNSPLRVLCWYGNRSTDPRYLADFDVVLTTYGILSGGKYGPLLQIEWFRVLLDESTYLKGGGGSCSDPLARLVGKRRWAVSGTPFGNKFVSFRATLRFLGVVPFIQSRPFQDLSSVLFNRREIRSVSLDPGKLSYLLKCIMVRHIKEQTLYGKPLVDLPAATGRLVAIKQDTEEREVYEKVERHVTGRAFHILRQRKLALHSAAKLMCMMIPLRTIADGVQPVNRGSGSDDGDIPLLPVMTGTGAKIKQLQRDVENERRQDPTAKFVVFTEFSNVKGAIQRTLKAAGYDVLTLDGSMTAHARGKQIQRFAEDNDAVAMVLSMRLGACGLTLTMANVVVLFEVGLKMATELQAVNRVHRIGQTRPVKTLTYVTEKSVDERMLAIRARQGQPRYVGDVSPSTSSENLSTLEIYRHLFQYCR